jgi:hypothetical protein
VAAALLLATGAMIGGPLTARAGALTGSVQSRTASCHAFGFHPLDSATGYDYGGEMLFRIGTGGNGFFACDPSLPDRAIVTKVQFSVSDATETGQVKFCGLYRSALINGFSHADELAAMDPTGIPDEPGFQRLRDASIQNATVDNKTFGYWLQCSLDQGGASLGLFGADVIYTISAANG